MDNKRPGFQIALAMPPPLRLTGLITSFNRPAYLRWVLLAHAAQTRPVDEVIITDDGSSEDMPGALADVLPGLPFPVTFVQQPNRGFRAAKCRNNGIRQATGDYLIFADQDIVFTPTYIETFRAQARLREFLVGFPVRLDEAGTARVTDAMVRQGAFGPLITPAAAWRIRRQHRKDTRFRWLHRLGLRRTGPNLRSGVFGAWRSDVLSINGFDEQYQGWGREDDDLGARLHRAGVSGRNVFREPSTLHLWHPVDAGRPLRLNVAYHAERLEAVRSGEVWARHGVTDPLGGDESTAVLLHNPRG